MHKFGALAFLQSTDVIKGFESLSLNLDDDYQDMIDYFEETYGSTFCLETNSVVNIFLGRLRPNHTRRKLMFDIESWNMYDRTIQS